MEKAKRTLLLFVLYSVILTAAAFFAGFSLRGYIPLYSGGYHLLEEAQSLLQKHFDGEIPEGTAMQYGMIRGMIATLNDPYTFFIEPSTHELQTDNLTGEYGGIGAHVTMDELGTIRLIPIDDSPAQQAGILEGDILLSVDGVVLTSGAFSVEQVVALIRGPTGSVVQLTMTHTPESATIQEYRIERISFPLPSVTGYLLPSDASIGVLALTLFSERTPVELEETYLDLTGRGAVALILDLRNNAGGLLTSSVDVARFFLVESTILIESSKGSEDRVYRVDRPGRAAEIPLAILVNGGTASAAEVVAAALQFSGRAPLFGATTYGKGSVQVVLELSDGSSLHVTSSRWQAPDGTNLDGAGLAPDFAIDEMQNQGDLTLSRASAWLRNRE